MFLFDKRVLPTFERCKDNDFILKSYAFLKLSLYLCVQNDRNGQNDAQKLVNNIKSFENEATLTI